MASGNISKDTSGFSVSQLLADDDEQQNPSEVSTPVPNDTPETSLHCMSSCLFGQQGETKTRPMLRCCLCMKWHHFKCIGENPKLTGIWTCSTCRDIPNDIKEIKTKINTFDMNKSSEILDILTDMKKELANLIHEQHSLQTTNADLINRLDIMAQEKADLQVRLSRAESALKSANIGSKSKTLLIGNSLIRNIQSENPDQLEIACHSGSTFETLTNELSKTTEVYDDIIIVTGTNDASNDINIAQIDAESKKMIQEAKKHSDNVSIASVLRKLKPDNQQLKIDHMNENLKKLSQDFPYCSYIDNDGTFRLADMSPNDALYVSDGCHLNNKGTQKLIDNLKLTKKATVRQFRKRSYQPLYDYGETSGQEQLDRRPSTQPRYQSNRSPSCIWCQGTDHSPSFCPKRRLRRCFHCNESDHMIRQCPWRR